MCPHEDESWQDNLLDVSASKTYSLPALSQTTGPCVILYTHYSLRNSQRRHTRTQCKATSCISNSLRETCMPTRTLEHDICRSRISGNVSINVFSVRYGSVRKTVLFLTPLPLQRFILGPKVCYYTDKHSKKNHKKAACSCLNEQRVPARVFQFGLALCREKENSTD